jgi:hypothetical protein
MKLFVAITEDNEVFCIDLDKTYAQKQKYISIHINGYREMLDDESGEEKARDELEDESYWEGLGYFGKDFPDILRNNIDFKAVADECINSDGWQHTLGDYDSFGDYDNKEWFMQNYCSTSEIEGDIKAWLIPQSVFNELMKLSEHSGFGPDPDFDNKLKRVEEIFDKYSAMCSSQKVLEIFKELEELDSEGIIDYMSWHVDSDYKYHTEKLKKQNKKLLSMLVAEAV